MLIVDAQIHLWEKGTHKGFGAGVVLGEISIDGTLQVGDRAEDATADALPRHRQVGT